MLAKENVFTWQATACVTVLHCTLEVLAAIKERMQTDDEMTATKFVKVNAGDDQR